MKEKRITSVYVEKRLLEMAKVMGINISEVLNETLKALVEDDTVLQLKEIEKKIVELEAELSSLRAKREAIRKAKEEELSKKNKKEAVRRTLEKLKAVIRAKNEAAGTKAETELNREMMRLKAELTRLTGIPEGSADWVDIMRALNLEGVEEATQVALRRQAHE